MALPSVGPHVRHAWHIFPVLLDLERLRADRRAVLVPPFAPSTSARPCTTCRPTGTRTTRSRGYARGLCPQAEAAFARLLTLPLFPGMTDGDVDDVLAAVRKVLGHYAR